MIAKKQKKDNIFRDIALTYCIPEDVVETICRYPFKYAADVISSDDDLKDIMFAYLFRFKLKPAYAKDKYKRKESSTKEEA